MIDYAKTERAAGLGEHSTTEEIMETAESLGLSVEQMRTVLDYGARRYPEGYDFRITRNDFTHGELQAKIRKRGTIVAGWFHVAWCDDVL